MERLKKILIFVLIAIIIGHILLYFLKEQSLSSSLLGMIGMICLIISITISKSKEK